MTMQEASERYGIPLWILRAYESWGLCPAAACGRYDDADLHKLSLIMTLCGIGFSGEQVRRYMLLQQDGPQTCRQRLAMLEERRCAILDEIHCGECRLQRLDYLRHELKKDKGGTMR